MVLLDLLLEDNDQDNLKHSLKKNWMVQRVAAADVAEVEEGEREGVVIEVETAPEDWETQERLNCLKSQV